VDGRQVYFVDVLACERASFDVVGEVAPVALQEGDRADEAIPERRQLDRSSCKQNKINRSGAKLNNS